MKLGLENFRSLVYRKPVETQKKTYLCWKCSRNYENPADYLWHIQSC